MNGTATKAGIGEIRRPHELGKIRYFEEGDFSRMRGLDDCFTPDATYDLISRNGDAKIIREPFDVALQYEKMIRERIIGSPDHQLSSVIADMVEHPLEKYSDIYLIGNYLSACINANIKIEEYFPDLSQLADGVYGWFQKMEQSELESTPEALGKLKQPLPVLFINLAEMYYNRGDYDSARKWYLRTYEVSCRLGTLHFAFISLQEYLLLECHISTSLGRKTISDNKKDSILEYLGKMNHWTEAAYDVRIRERGDPIGAILKRKTRNANKLRLVKIVRRGEKVMKSLWKQGIGGYRDTVAKSVDRVVGGGDRDDQRKYNELIQYVRDLRRVKEEYIAFTQNRELDSFLDADIRPIASCEVMIATMLVDIWDKIPRELLHAEELGWYLSPTFWTSVGLSKGNQEIINRGFSGKEEGTGASSGSIQTSKLRPLARDIRTTVLNLDTERDLRYHWMDIFNKLFHRGSLVDHTRVSQYGAKILRQIASNIAGINPFAASTLSQFFMNSSEHPIVKRFIENMTALSAQVSADPPITPELFEHKHYSNNTTYQLSSLGIYMRDFLQGISKYDNIREYFDTYYGVGNWLIKYPEGIKLGELTSTDARKISSIPFEDNAIDIHVGDKDSSRILPDVPPGVSLWLQKVFIGLKIQQDQGTIRERKTEPVTFLEGLRPVFNNLQIVSTQLHADIGTQLHNLGLPIGLYKSMQSAISRKIGGLRADTKSVINRLFGLRQDIDQPTYNLDQGHADILTILGVIDELKHELVGQWIDTFPESGVVDWGGVIGAIYARNVDITYISSYFQQIEGSLKGAIQGIERFQRISVNN